MVLFVTRCLQGSASCKLTRVWSRSEKAQAKQVMEVSEGGTVKTSAVSHFSEAGMVEKYKGPNGTVGAVAVDAQGNMAAATSTGGMTNKMTGRVGDTAVVGAVRCHDAAHCPSLFWNFATRAVAIYAITF